MSFYALKDRSGFPIPGTMIKLAISPGQNYIELKNKKSPTSEPCFKIGGGVSGAVNPTVDKVLVMNDGNYLIAGTFSTYVDSSATILKLSYFMMKISPAGVPVAAFTSAHAPGGNGLRILCVDNNNKILISPNDLPAEQNYEGSPYGSYVIRIDGTTGARDNTFNAADFATFPVQSVVPLPDGKYLVGSNRFRRLCVLNADGTIFAEDPIGAGISVGAAPNILKLSSGEFILYGAFQNFGKGLCKLNANFSQNGVFNTNIGVAFNQGFNAPVSYVSEAPDGKLLVVGDFSSFHEIPRKYVLRLNADGTLDTSFNAGNVFSAPAPVFIQQIKNRIYICTVDTYDGKTVNKLIAVDNYGFLDTSFKLANVSGTVEEYTNPTGDWVLSMMRQVDDKILLCGSFTQVNKKPHTGFCVIDQDGDPTDCDVKKIRKRHPRGFRYFVKLSPNGDVVPNSLIASKTDPGYAHEEIIIVQ